MVKYDTDDELDTLFSALSDRTRRHVLQSLSEGDRAVSELAVEHRMSLPGFMKHLGVLESAGLIARTKEGRVVSCELSAAPMKGAVAWMSRYEKFWTEKLDSLARYLYHQRELQTSKKPPAGTPRPAPIASGWSRRKASGTRGPGKH